VSVSENLAADFTCGGNPRNCEILVGLDEDYVKRCQDAGITDSDSIVHAMAVGLVIEAWRNGLVEDMHASRRGPSDAAMFAESTALHDEALRPITDEGVAVGGAFDSDTATGMMSATQRVAGVLTSWRS
jgi:hypothetical protein